MPLPILIMGRLALVRELGGEMVVWNPAREIRAILDLAGMERLVRVEYPAEADRTSPPPKSRSTGGKRTRRRASTPTREIKKEKEA